MRNVCDSVTDDTRSVAAVFYLVSGACRNLLNVKVCSLLV